MSDNLFVTKRSGELAPFDFEKVHRVLFWSVEDIAGVSVSEIEIKTKMQLYNKIPTAEIHETLIKSAANLISEENPNYQYVAARLAIFTLRKIVYKQFEPLPLLEHVKKCIESGVYDKDIINLFNDDEWQKLDKIVKHERDMLLSYAGVEQFRGKYLVQNRTTKEYFETPQMAYILIAAILFNKYPEESKMQYIKDYYDAISKGPKSTITIPTPVLAGVRTPTKQYSSCVIISAGDSLNSINEVASSIVDYASRRAGLGINVGKIRAKGSPVRNGDVFHTGNVPYYKYFLGALRSCSQGGIRSASATCSFPIWTYEAEDLIVLKNNKGTEETRVREMDYAVQINGYLYKRLIKNEKITLFSPNDVQDLYEAFFNDQELFAELYEKYERAYSIRKKTISALEHISNVLIERNNTGRIYIQNVDHCNTHGAFNPDTSPVYQNNLCMEINLPTADLTRISRIPFDKIKHTEEFKEITKKEFTDQYGEIALCTLSSINWGMISDPKDFEKPCELAIRALNELLEYQDYPMIAAGIPALKRKSLGIGISNLAYFIAKRDMKYSDGSANDTVNEYAESMSYYLIKASMELAKEKGKCGWFDETKYSNGILPIHTYKKNVDDLLKKSNYLNWDTLIEDIKKYGMINSTVMAVAPVESSSQIINATNGIEPPRDIISIKLSKNGSLKQVIPEIHRLKNKYEYLWDMPHTRGYLEIAAIIQKWTDQTISTNTSYNPKNYIDNKIPMSELIKDLIYAYKLGLFTLYYQNTNDGAGEVDLEESCENCKL